MLKIFRLSRLSALVLVFTMLSISLPAHSLAISNQSISSITNQQRSANGLPALDWNAALANSAWLKATDICANGYWAHTAPDGTTGWQLMSRSGYNYTVAGENLAKGFTDDVDVVAGWMASAGHRANILDQRYMDIGVGSASCMFEGAETTIVVAHYGKAASSAAHARKSTAPSKSKQTSAVAKSTKVLPATETAPQPVEPPKTEPKRDDSQTFGAMVWQMSRAHNKFGLSDLLA